MVMSYLQSSVLMESESLTALHNLLCANGWSMWTAAAVALLCLFHWPCSTTCLTIYKETGSTKWTLLSILLPTIIGFSLCFLLNLMHTHHRIIKQSAAAENPLRLIALLLF